MAVIDAAIAKALSFGDLIPKDYFNLPAKGHFVFEKDVKTKYVINALSDIMSIVVANFDFDDLNIPL